jgi:hypothetical protein
LFRSNRWCLGVIVVQMKYRNHSIQGQCCKVDPFEARARCWRVSLDISSGSQISGF